MVEESLIEIVKPMRLDIIFGNDVDVLENSTFFMDIVRPQVVGSASNVMNIVTIVKKQ